MRAAAFLLLAFAFATADARAYQREEHYISVRLGLGEMQPQDAARIAACAQLADEAPELNAIAVYLRLMEHPVDYSSWVLRARGSAETAGHMVTVQAVLHGLNGGNPQGVRVVARRAAADLSEIFAALPKDAAQDRADALCATGFALHLYGDAHAHQMLKNPERMYRTGIGHLFDASSPDLPFSSPARFELWKSYVSSIPRPAPDPVPDWEPIFQRAAAGNASAPGAALLEAERGALRATGEDRFYAPFDARLAKKGCQALADAQSAASGLSPAPLCERAWALYRDTAIGEFEAYDAAHRDQPSRAPLTMPYFTGSPFSKGPKW